MTTVNSQSERENGIELKSKHDQSQAGGKSAERLVYRDLTLSDFLPQPTESPNTIDQLNEFFNSTQIKQDLHWFTHRDTLVRAFDRNNRELFYLRPQGSIVAAAMVWCGSRVLDVE